MIGRLNRLADRLDAQVRLLLRRSAIVAVIRVIGLACVFCLQILLARLIGDSGEYGVYAWGQSLLYMAGTIAGMGVPVATSRFVASLSAQSRERAVGAVIHRAWVLLTRSSTALVLVGFALLFVRWQLATGNVYLGVAGLALVFAPGVTFSILYQQLCWGRQWFNLAYLPLQVARPVLTGVLATGLWYLGGHRLDGQQTLLLVGLSLVLISAPQALIYQRRQGRLPLTGAEDRDSGDYNPAALFRTARPLLVTRIAEVSIKYSNVLLVGVLAGPAVAGAYFAAERLAELASTPATIVKSVSQAETAAAHARGDRSALVAVSVRAARVMVWPTLAITAVLSVFAGPLVSLFGDGFSAAAPVLVILAVGYLLQASIGPVFNLLVMTGHQRFLPRVMTVTAGLHVVLLLLLVPPLGAIGAALSIAINGIFNSLWLLLLVRRELGINPTVFAKTPARDVVQS